MAQEILYYDEGDTASLTMTFTNPNTGENVVPGNVYLHWEPTGQVPAATPTVWHAGVDPQISVGPTTVNSQILAVGQYLALLPLAVTNGRKQQRYECRWESTGTWASTHPFAIVVTAKNV